MKVLFVADGTLKNPASGSEQVLHQQATGLIAQGMDVFALTRQEGRAPTIHRDVKGVEEACYSLSTKSVPGFFSSLLREPPRLYDVFSKDRPFDAAICHHPFTYFALLATGRLSDIPTIHVFHSPTHEEYHLLHKKRGWLRNVLPVRARWMIEKYCHKRSTRIMVLSEYMKQKVVDIYGIPDSRIIVNPGGVDLNFFQPPVDRERLKRNLDFPKGRIHLFTVRNLEPRMGLDNLLKCIHILKRNQTRTHLILGGEGAERENLEDLIGKYDLSDSVTMMGFIPSDRLPEYYGAADFFILPTRRLEGFGLVTVESMACGTPVLGTPVGGTKEILSAFDSRFLFKDSSPEAMAVGVEAAINKNFARREEYDALRVQCRGYAERNYSWNRHVDQLRSIIDEAISSRHKGL